MDSFGRLDWNRPHKVGVTDVSKVSRKRQLAFLGSLETSVTPTCRTSRTYCSQRISLITMKDFCYSQEQPQTPDSLCTIRYKRSQQRRHHRDASGAPSHGALPAWHWREAPQ